MMTIGRRRIHIHGFVTLILALTVATGPGMLITPTASSAAGPACAAEPGGGPAGGVQPDWDNRVQPPEPASVGLERDFGHLPLYFVQNQGQVDEQVAYYIQGSDKTIYFTSEGLTLAIAGEALTPGPSPIDSMGEGGRATAQATPTNLVGEGRGEAAHTGPRDSSPALPRPRGETPPRQRWVVKLDFLGANPDVRPEGLERTEATISYFKGRPDEWRTRLPTYARIAYRELWPGIDLVYYGGASHGAASRLKYEFLVHPGANPAQIRLAYRGASAVWLNEMGQLQVSTPLGGFADEAPLAYQEGEGGQRLAVDVAYAAPEEQEAMPGGSQAFSYGFRLGPYDPGKPLVLDPAVLLYCGYIGGSGGAYSDYGVGIAVDGAGNAYVMGYTNSSEATFPETVGPDLSYNGSTDAFVAKVNAAGTALDYCGYIGGSDWEGAVDHYGRGSIAVDGEGNAYVTGETHSSEATFPVMVGPDLSYSGGYSDAFVAKVNAAGTALDYCGYIGGSSAEYGYGIAVDGAGNAYITGGTGSSEATLPVTVGPDLSHNGSTDTFVAKVNEAGTALDYCGYIGGSSADWGVGIAVDRAGNAYVMGTTDSSEATFPVTVGPDPSFNGVWDAFVAKVNAAGTALLYCGYIGGHLQDWGRGIAVDGEGNAYVTGETPSSEVAFPVTVGPDLIYNGGEYDAFVGKVNAAGTALIYSGYIGGDGWDSGNGIAVDGAGNAYVTGYTTSSRDTFPVGVGPDLSYNGLIDVFVAKVSAAGTALDYCGYIGGSDEDLGYGIAVDGAGNAYVTGFTTSTEATFPETVGPDLSHNGGDDAFVAKVSLLVVAVHVPLLLRPSSPTQ